MRRAERPRSPCSEPRCPQLATYRGRCPTHAREYEQRRGTTGDRGYNYEWQGLRERKLLANPWCQCDDCRAAGAKVKAVDVDHIRSVREAPHLRLVWSNLRSMAHGHHSRRTNREQR